MVITILFAAIIASVVVASFVSNQIFVKMCSMLVIILMTLLVWGVKAGVFIP